MQQLRVLFAVPLLYMFRVTFPPIIRSTMAFSVLLMMSEIVTRNMQSKAITENKNAIVASCWTYFTTMRQLILF